MKTVVTALIICSIFIASHTPQYKLFILINTQSCINCYLYASYLHNIKIPIILIYSMKDAYQAKKFTAEVLKLQQAKDTISDALYNRLSSNMYGGATCFIIDSLYHVKSSYQFEQLPERTAEINMY